MHLNLRASVYTYAPGYTATLHHMGSGQGALHINCQRETVLWKDCMFSILFRLLCVIYVDAILRLGPTPGIARHPWANLHVRDQFIPGNDRES